MKRNNIIQNIQSFKLPVIRILLVFGIFSLIISCEAEDDIPPPSAYVAPEPVEGCIQLVGVPELSEGINFECEYPEIGTFGETDAGSITVEPSDNPDKEGINTSDKVIMVTQTAGVEGYAGLFFDLASKVDFSEEQSIKIKIYSPGVGQNILLKLEDSADATINKEVGMTTTVANEWEEISFAFSPSDSDKFDKMVLFFDFNGDKDATTVHYFDDIVLAAGGGGTVATTTSFPVNFETPANGGAAENWSVFENVDNPALEIISNPDASGANTTATVAQFTARKDGQAYAGTITQLETPFTLSAANSTVKILVWKTVISDVAIKFENAAGGSTGEIKVANTKTNEWEELTFDFSGVVGDPNNTNITGLIVFPDFNDSRTQDNVVYFDNINLSGDGTSGGTNPTASAPTPTLDAANVISLFSDAYTDVAVDTWRTEWSAVDYTETTVDGNDVKLYSNLNFVGIETIANQIDASSMTHFHLDYWTGNASVFRVKLVDFGPDGGFDGGDDTEDEIEFTVTPNTWVSLDIPLSDFAGLTNREHMSQFIFSAAPAGEANVYIDNVYFYKETAASTEPQSAAPTPTVDAANVISLFSDAYTDVAVDTWRTEWSAVDYTETTVDGNDVKLYSNLNFVGIETIANQIDASSMTHFHVDYWTGNASVFRVKLVDFGPDGGFDGGDDTEDEIEFPVTPNTWVSLDIPLSDFAGLTNREHMSQFIFSAAPAGGANVYIDNVYFHN
jgi:uncharacterized protein YciU (UPF0263 family)